MADECRPVEVDGEMIRVRGGSPMNDEDRDAFIQIVRAAKAKFTADLAEQHTTALADQSAHYARNPIQDDARGDDDER